MKTVSYKEFVNEVESARALLAAKTHNQELSRRVWIVNVGTGDQVEMAVSVAGTGDMSSATARAFARCVEEAATIAEQFKFNGYTVI